MDKGSGMACMSLNIAKSRRFGMALAVSHGNCEHTCLTLETYHGLPASRRSIRPSRGSRRSAACSLRRHKGPLKRPFVEPVNRAVRPRGKDRCLDDRNRK